jgi:hypothetical protein
MSAGGDDSRMPMKAPITNTSAAGREFRFIIARSNLKMTAARCVHIVKGVKRAMAGEYSRELSSKVFQGACRLIQLGFKQGGTAGFGLRRMLIDQSGQQKACSKWGSTKAFKPTG